MVRMMSPRSPIRRKTGSISSAEPPAARLDLFGQTQPAELLQASRLQALAKCIAPGSHADHAALIGLLEQRPVEAGESLLLDFLTQGIFDDAIRTRPQIERHDLCRPLAHPVGDVFAGDDEILAAIILAAQHDMGMGMAGVVVIDRHPIELGAQIVFHLRHQAARERL